MPRFQFVSAQGILDHNASNGKTMSLTIIPPSAIRQDPSELGAMANGRLQLMPTAFYERFSQAEISMFAVRNGLYAIPTRELAAWLKSLIGDTSVLEIGAGNGVLAEALAIRATDNYMQTWPEISAHYHRLRQAPVVYGPRVENLDAHAALAAYQPDTVLACWVTHRYDAQRHELGGNMYGVDELAILRGCKTYVHVGNAKTHELKPLKALPHRVYRPYGLVSRSLSAEDNEVCVWGAVLPGEAALSRS